MHKILYLFQLAFLFGLFFLFLMEKQVLSIHYHSLRRRLLKEVKHHIHNYEQSGIISSSPFVDLICNYKENVTKHSKYPPSSPLVPLTSIPHLPGHLDKEMMESGTELKKVLLLGYLKGGSTFLGRLFASNPDAFYCSQYIWL